MTKTEPLICMHCKTPTVESVIHNGTHIHICKNCPNVTVEFSTTKDLKNAMDYLETKNL